MELTIWRYTYYSLDAKGSADVKPLTPEEKKFLKEVMDHYDISPVTS